MTASPPAAASPGAGRRVAIVAALVAAAVAGGVVDRLPHRTGDAGPAAQVATLPVAAPSSSLSSSWFCAVATATAGGAADGWVILANAGDREVHGTLTVVPSEGEANSVPVTVAPGSRTVVHEADVVTAPYVAALAEVDGGDVVVEQQVSGPQGLSTAPCASAASDRWYLAEGSTARQEGAADEDAMLLALYNPFPVDAIVDLSFATEDGRRVPSEFTGLVVRGGRLLMVNVGDHVRRRANIAVTAVSRSGRIVVDRLQLRNGAVKGMSLALAAPSPGDAWYFPEGLVSDGLSESFHLYNPSEHEAEVTIELSLEQGSAEPFDLTIPPRERLTLVADKEDRVPRGVGHAATVRSLNGVPVVAERSFAAKAPSPRLGATDALGARRAAKRWVFAAGSATAATDEWIVLFNPGSTPAKVSVRGLLGQVLPLEGLQAVAVPPHRRVAVRITDHIGNRDELPLLVRSSVPIVAERGMYRVGAVGIALSSGVPLR
jgi:hypothetical protein